MNLRILIKAESSFAEIVFSYNFQDGYTLPMFCSYSIKAAAELEL